MMMMTASVPSTSLLRSSLRSLRGPTYAFNHSTTSRSVVTLKEIKYTATATAKGAGRDGQVKCDGLKFNLALPKELGGTGKGENPEQLFAMGYSACFLSAIHSMARKLGKEEMAKEAVVRASVHIGTPNDLPGFGLAVDLKVDGVDQELLDAAHGHCPYSRALNKGIIVNVSTT